MLVREASLRRGPALRSSAAARVTRRWAVAGGDSERRGTRASAGESVCVAPIAGVKPLHRRRHRRRQRDPGTRAGAPRDPGHPILPARGPPLQLRVSRRSRRDPRPHAHHLLRHPELHCPALPGAAALDGADPRARAIRAGGQAHAPLGCVQPGRRRRVQPAGVLDERPDRRSSSASSGSRATRSRSRRTASSTSTGRRSTSPTRSRTTPGSTSRRPSPDCRTLGGARGRAVRHGRPPPALGRLPGLRADQRRRRDRTRLPALLAAVDARRSCRRRPTPASRRRPTPTPRRRPTPTSRRQPPDARARADAVTPLLVALAVLVAAGGVVAVSAREPRFAVLGMIIALVGAAYVADPLPGLVALAARLAGAALAGYLVWVALRRAPAPTARLAGRLARRDRAGRGGVRRRVVRGGRARRRAGRDDHRRPLGRRRRGGARRRLAGAPRRAGRGVRAGRARRRAGPRRA